MIENQRLEIIAPFGREKKVSREYASVFSPGRKDFFIKKAFFLCALCVLCEK